jgi:hypothetical protein
MNRRRFLGKSGRMALGLLGLGVVTQTGCRGRQTARVLMPGEPDMVGSHTAGAATYGPLVDEAVARLLARHGQPVQQTPAGPAYARRICFVGVENKSIEEMGDFKEQIYQQIDTRIAQSGAFEAVSRRFVEAGLRQTRLRPDQLFVPSNMARFQAVMEQMGQPFDYLLYATLTSGTTRSNKDYQRDYLLTLEMVELGTGHYDKESAELSKGYNRSLAAKAKHFRPFW